MSDFKTALDVVLNHEKGWSNNPSDLGGPTNFGISQVAYSHFLRRPVSTDEIRCMTVEQASEVYLVMFWEPLNLGKIENQKLATIIFDMAVLMGQEPVIKALQIVLSFRLPIDGHLGPETIEEVNSAKDIVSVCRLVLERCQTKLVYDGISRNDQKFFLPGWIARTHDLMNLAFGGN